jgi:hypothetical protein
VPILIGLALFFLPCASLYKWRELLGNLFVLTLGNIFWTVLATVVLSFSLLVTFRVVLLNGKERFGIQQGLTKDMIPIRNLVTAEALGVPMWLAAIFANGQASNPGLGVRRVAVAIAALVAAHVLGFLVLLLSVWVSPRYHERPENRFPLFGWMGRWLGKAYDKDWCTDGTRQKWGNWAKKLPKAFRAGYFDRRTGLFFPGQWLSLLMLICSFGLYELMGWRHADLSGRFGVPAIGYVVLLLIFLNWVLSIGAFFLDRYRFPLLLALLGLVSASNLTWKSDHFYETRQAGYLPTANPAEILNSALRAVPDHEHPYGRVAVVATAGGGIQAAAWTAQVLTGLQSELQERSGKTPISFAKSIAAISSVSGGAVGTMFFVNQYGRDGQKGFVASGPQLRSIVQMSEAPALDEVAWGLLYPDFTRIVFPYLKLSLQRKLIDRGWALENTWRRRANLTATLGQWRLGVHEGWRPATIFNATIVESGEPLILATTDLQTSTSTGLRRRTFSQLLPGYDLPVVTAARLAASFPYVSPASRALLEQTQLSGLNPDQLRDVRNNSTYHVVDGGYYDNYGIDSLLAWLDEALMQQPPGKVPEILLIQIRSFPSEAKSPPAKTRGWTYQAYAPASALMRVRTTGQLVRDQEAIEIFRRRWAANGVHIRLATFEFAGNDAPLSWKMNPKQIQGISEEWSKRISGPNNQDWTQVECFFLPLQQDCGKLGAPLNKGPW